DLAPPVPQALFDEACLVEQRIAVRSPLLVPLGGRAERIRDPGEPLLGVRSALLPGPALELRDDPAQTPSPRLRPLVLPGQVRVDAVAERSPGVLSRGGTDGTPRAGREERQMSLAHHACAGQDPPTTFFVSRVLARISTVLVVCAEVFDVGRLQLAGLL